MSGHTPTIEQLDIARSLVRIIGPVAASELLASWCGMGADDARRWIESPFRGGPVVARRGH